ncbi:mannose-1-phosphate guanylyltransferase [Caviibacterium pharyngocola]|uniref:mannose-1-phosphate guanylyltransferase n=1 Tax=Caviibacterium pharyngocola TaxID=28159 RepID=A0A2M8RXA2_9PAST|nr:mannose-1-phosphate guanylyltransferase [Caviibacterium pharyngocola]PJG83504.1 mannose-1-phosphate guanylyltransferase/mannose-6-phosphate isomerase [Caviibacterium pharyngocola]
MINIILCGGSGTRLWPLSRTQVPKQFIKLFHGKSLYQLTLSRNIQCCDSVISVVNNDQFSLIEEQSSEVNNISYLKEPIGRNTAPAIALACLGLNPDDIVLVTSSDQLIKNEKNYLDMVKKAKKFAENGFLVTFGLKPKYPETGFGYIETLDEENVLSFREKPNFETAKQYVESGRYFWNCGIFCFKAGVLLSELEKYSPDVYKGAKAAYANRMAQNNVESINMDDMLNIPSDSIDYAVMEKSTKIKVVCGDLGWSDVGSFDSLEKEFAKDENSNTDTECYVAINSNNNFIWSNKRVVTIDIDDLIVVDTEDALLIAKKGSSQKVKEAVEYLKEIEPQLIK